MLRAILEKRWRRVHGVGKDDWKREDWSWWEPGVMVSWCEIHGDDPHFLFPIGEEEIWADDGYCVTPKCSCREAAVTFRRVADLGGEPYAELRVDLRGWTAAPRPVAVPSPSGSGRPGAPGTTPTRTSEGR